MKRTPVAPFNCPLLAASLLAAACSLPAQALTLYHLGPFAAPASCAANDVNDSGTAVGTCTASIQSWVQTLSGAPVELKPLVAGQVSTPVQINGSGYVMGTSTIPASGARDEHQQGVVWNSSATPPLNGTSLRILLLDGLNADTQAVPKWLTEGNRLVGQSCGPLLLSDPNALQCSAVAWLASNGTAKRLFPSLLPGLVERDQCMAMNATDDTTRPTALSNCPSAGISQVDMKTSRENTLGVFVPNTVPKATGSLYCNGLKINNSKQILGSCFYPPIDTPVRKVAYWANPTSQPSVQANASAPGYFNNLGHAVIATSTDFLFLDPVSNATQVIPPPANANLCQISALAANKDIALMICTMNDNTLRGFVWQPLQGLTSLGDDQGVPVAGSEISPNGNYVSGFTQDPTGFRKAWWSASPSLQRAPSVDGACYGPSFPSSTSPQSLTSGSGVAIGGAGGVLC